MLKKISKYLKQNIKKKTSHKNNRVTNYDFNQTAD